MRAQRDYDTEIIKGADLSRIRGAATARIEQLQAERLIRGRSGVPVFVLGRDDPASVFRDVSLHVRREVIDLLGKVWFSQFWSRKGFDPM